MTLENSGHSERNLPAGRQGLRPQDDIGEGRCSER